MFSGNDRGVPTAGAPEARKRPQGEQATQVARSWCRAAACSTRPPSTLCTLQRNFAGSRHERPGRGTQPRARGQTFCSRLHRLRHPR